MNLVKLSSKGQLVIPKALREALGIGPGTVLKLTLHGRQLILEPVALSLIDRLYGKFTGDDLLTDLEAEHRHEILREPRA